MAREVIEAERFLAANRLPLCRKKALSASATATWRSTLLYGALFGFFCYATFELTSLSLLKHWTWPVVMMDVAWGSFVTALSSTLGLSIANWITPKIDRLCCELSELS